MPRNNVPTQITPPRHRSLTLIARNDQTPLITLLCLHIHLNIEHYNRPQIPHSLLRHSEQFRPILIKLHPFDRRVEIPHFDTFTRADIPEADGVVGGAGGEEGSARVDVDGPKGALVAVVGAEAFTVGGEPGADYLVFGTGEEDVAVFGISTSKSQRSLLGEEGGCLWGRDTLDLSQGPFLCLHLLINAASPKKRQYTYMALQ